MLYYSHACVSINMVPCYAWRETCLSVPAQQAATGDVCSGSTTMQDKKTLFWLQLPSTHQKMISSKSNNTTCVAEQLGHFSQRELTVTHPLKWAATI